MKKNIHVVGAVIVEKSKVFCAQRGPKKSLPLLWEFPGGKIESGETPETALKREIKGELKCVIEVGDKVEHTVYEYDFGIVHLTTYLCKLVEGRPILTEHNDYKWLTSESLNQLNWAPADIPAIEKLSKMQF